MTSQENIKKRIAHIITGNEFDPSKEYEEELEYIYNNQYKTVLKVPAKTFILGTCARFKDQNLALKLLKQVITEAMELSGVELTFVDEEWDNLNIVSSTEGYHSHKWILANSSNEIKKNYMSQFFEL
jgi:hypothetical protein